MEAFKDWRMVPDARLLIGKQDAAMLRQTPPPDEDSAKALAHWLSA